MVDVKKRLLDLLAFFASQVENDECTIDEMESVFKVMTREINARATVKELSGFFGQPEANVRNVISRNYVSGKDKPTRRVSYHLGRFIAAMPASWKHDKN